jgi:hypothetical protein
MEKNKKNTAVEWLQQLYDYSPESCIIDDEFERAKEIEKQQQGEFAIGFAYWCEWRNDRAFKTYEELLEIYKNKKDCESN